MLPDGATVLDDNEVEIETTYQSYSNDPRWLVRVIYRGRHTPWSYACRDVTGAAHATGSLCVDAGSQLYLSINKTRELGRAAQRALFQRTHCECGSPLDEAGDCQLDKGYNLFGDPYDHEV